MSFRGLCRIASGLLIACVALVVGADLALDTPPVRGLLVREVNRALRGTFKGKIVIDRVGYLGWDRAADLDAHVEAPDGTVVIATHGGSARVAPLAMLTSFFRKGPFHVDVFDVSLDSVEVDLLQGPDGTPAIACAFEPAAPSAPDGAPGRVVLLTLPRIRVRHTLVRHDVPAEPDAAADLDDLRASVQVSPSAVAVDVSRVAVAGRASPAHADPHGSIEAHLRVPSLSGSTFGLKAAFRGDVGGVPASADCKVDSDSVEAVVDVPDAKPDAMRALLEGWPVRRPVTLHAEARGPWSAVQATAHASVGSAQVELGGEIALRGAVHATATLDARDVDPGVFTDAPVHADVTLHAAGSVRFDRTPSVDVGVKATATEVAAGPARIARLQMSGRASGPLADPGLAATVEATTLEVGPYSFRSGNVTTYGPVRHQDVGVTLLGEPSVRAGGHVSIGDAIVIDRASVTLSRNQQDLAARIDRVRIDGGAVDVENASITGVGETTHATLHVRPGSVAARADSGGLDLRALGYLLGIEQSLREGRASFAVNVDARPGGAHGTATVDMTNGCFLDVDGLTGHVAARMTGRTIAGTLDAKAAGIGSVKVTGAEVHVGGTGPLDVRAWRRIWGKVEVDGDVDLARAASLLRPDTLPFSQLSGQVHLHARLGRDSESDTVPNLQVSLLTAGLRVGGKSGPDRRSHGTVLVAPPPWSLAGINLAVDASIAGAGLTEVSARLVDARGAIVAADAKSDAVPYARMFGGPGAGLAQLLARMPFKARITVPERSLESLPDILRPEAVTGEGAMTASIEGTGLDPSVDLHGTARSMRLLDAPRVAPLDADFTVKYDGHTAQGETDVRSGTATLLHAVTQIRAEAASLVSRTPAWSASMQGVVTNLPLSILPFVAERGLHGDVSGRFDLTGLHDDARFTADLDLTGLRVAKTAYGKAHVKAAFDGHLLEASADFDEGDGHGRLAAKAGAIWGDRVLPALDSAQPAEASLQASRMRVGVLAPFIQGTVEDLEGRLDADARVALAPGQQPVLSGSATLSEGQVALAQLGQELRAVRGKVTFEPGGVVRLSDCSADGVTGKLTASALAHLDGMHLVDADAGLDIAKRDAMPLAVEGTEVGTVYGKATVHAAESPDGHTLSMRVDVPSWHVQLPDASTHGVQDLGAPPPEVHVGVYASPGRFMELAVDGAVVPGNDASRSGDPASQVAIEVHLGEDVEVRRGTDVKVGLSGAVTAKMEKKTAVTGQIRLHRGTLDVQGKNFEIESGTVTFTGDPGNPLVHVTAAWPAADGTRVFADYLGPLKTGKVTLRSEPPRPQNEILALVMFGSADGSASTPYSSPQPDAATKAGTTVGAFATGGLSKGLDRLTGMDITAKIDASQANPRPEVEVQIARDISLQLAFVLGTPPPGTNPDTTYATIDWRFLRNWSLETTFGNLGSSIADLVWRKRY